MRHSGDLRRENACPNGLSVRQFEQDGALTAEDIIFMIYNENVYHRGRDAGFQVGQQPCGSTTQKAG